MATLVFFLLRNRKSAHEKPEISYPNSIIPGNAVKTLNNNANGRTSTMIPDTDSESEEDSHVVIRQLSDESSSEDEIQKIKVCQKNFSIQNSSTFIRIREIYL